MKKLRLLDTIPIKLSDGSVKTGKIRRFGASDPTHQGFVMLTLDVGGQLGYCAAKETEIATDDGHDAA